MAHTRPGILLVARASVGTTDGTSTNTATSQNHEMIYIIFKQYVIEIAKNIADDGVSRLFNHDHNVAAMKINTIITSTANNAPSIIANPLL